VETNMFEVANYVYPSKNVAVPQGKLNANKMAFTYKCMVECEEDAEAFMLQHQRFQSGSCNDVLIEHVCLESEKDMGRTWTFKSNLDIHRMTHYMEWMNSSLRLHQMIRTLMLAKHFKAGGATLNPIASENRHLYATDTEYLKAIEQYVD
jgi:hypothetical protein